MVIFAFATAAPVASVTVPTMVPYTACAHMDVADKTIEQNNRINFLVDMDYPLCRSNKKT